MASGSLWVLFTLLASSAQTLRNAMQRDLIGALGAVGAAQVRFLFGLPFAVLFLAGMLVATGLATPQLTLPNLGWTAFGAVSQVIATAMMLAAMRTRSFVVAVAYTKTEPAQVALFGLVAFNETPTLSLIAAIGLAMIGVALMSVPSRKELASDWRSAAYGLASATFFAFAAIGFRSAVVGVETSSRALAASLILVVGLAIQSATLALYLGAFDRAGARAILAAWRSSLFAGFHGRARLPILVHRLRADRRGAGANARADRGAAGAARIAEALPRAAVAARRPRHDTDRRRRRDPRLGRSLRSCRLFHPLSFSGILLNPGSEILELTFICLNPLLRNETFQWVIGVKARNFFLAL